MTNHSPTFGALMAKTAECNKLRLALELACSHLSDEQAAQVAAAMPGCDETPVDAPWPEYVAGMVVAHLGGGVDDERVAPIAGIIRRRLWLAPGVTDRMVEVPAGLARSDAEFWLRHRSAIVTALRDAGLSIVSSAHGISLKRLGKAETA